MGGRLGALMGGRVLSRLGLLVDGWVGTLMGACVAHRALHQLNN